MITFRPLARSDLRTLQAWLNTPHVYEWWGSHAGSDSIGGPGQDAATEAQVEAKYGLEIDCEGPTHRFIIELSGAPIGLIQWYYLRDYAEYAAAIGEDPATAVGIDLMIGDAEAIGRGLGSCAIDEFVTVVLFSLPGVDRVVTGPAAHNARSIRAFEKAGFRRAREASIAGENAPEAVMVRLKPRMNPEGSNPEGSCFVKCGGPSFQLGKVSVRIL